MLNEITNQPPEPSYETAQCADSQSEKGYLPLSSRYRSDRSLLCNRLYGLQQFLPRIFGLLRRIGTFLSLPTMSFPAYQEEFFVHVFRKNDIWRASAMSDGLMISGIGKTKGEALECIAWEAEHA